LGLLGTDIAHPLVDRGFARSIRRPSRINTLRGTRGEHDEMAAGIHRPDSSQEKLTENLRCGAVQQHVVQICIAVNFASEADGIVDLGSMNERHVLALEAFQFPTKRSTDRRPHQRIGQIDLEMLELLTSSSCEVTVDDMVINSVRATTVKTRFPQPCRCPAVLPHELVSQWREQSS
jgi:hypothetical protein